jgi:hypothetical protein
VTEDRAKQMSRPQQPKQPKGAPLVPAAPAQAAQPGPAQPPAKDENAKKQIRSVGPPFIPAR